MYLMEVGVFVNSFPWSEPKEACEVVELSLKSQNKAVCFFSHAMDKNYIQIPSKWKGLIYTSKEIGDILSSDTTSNIPKKYIRLLRPNDSSPILLWNEKTVYTTMFPIESAINRFMLFFEDKHLKCLWTRELSDNYSTVLSNNALKNAIESVIDVLYVDGSCFEENTILDKQNNLHPREDQIASFVYLVRPMKVLSTTQVEELPQFIREQCVRPDFKSSPNESTEYYSSGRTSTVYS